MKFIELLCRIKKRPGMYMRECNHLHDLEMQFWGYQAAMAAHSISDDVSDFNRNFMDYILSKYKWSTCQGWSEAICNNEDDSDVAVTLFFRIANEFFKDEYDIENAIDEDYVE